MSELQGRVNAGLLVPISRWTVLLLAVLVWNIGAAARSAHGAVVDPDLIQVEPFPPGGDFVLMHANGPLALSELRGKVVLLFFGYTHCPDICPTTIMTLQMALRMLPESDRLATRVLFVSVDPERDTPSHVGAYAAHFGEQFLGLTGEPQAIAEVANRFGAQYRRVDLDPARENYAIEHPAAIHVIDTQGRLRALFRHTIAPKKLAGGIHHLLNETDHPETKLTTP